MNKIDYSQIGNILEGLANNKISEDELKDFIKRIIKSKNDKALRIDYKQKLKEGAGILSFMLTNLFIDFSISENERTDNEQTDNEQHPEDMLTTNEVINLLSITRKTFYNWKDRGLITKLIGGKRYVLRKDLNDFIDLHNK